MIFQGKYLCKIILYLQLKYNVRNLKLHEQQMARRIEFELLRCHFLCHAPSDKKWEDFIEGIHSGDNDTIEYIIKNSVLLPD